MKSAHLLSERREKSTRGSRYLQCRVGPTTHYEPSLLRRKVLLAIKLWLFANHPTGSHTKNSSAELSHRISKGNTAARLQQLPWSCRWSSKHALCWHSYEAKWVSIFCGTIKAHILALGSAAALWSYTNTLHLLHDMPAWILDTSAKETVWVSASLNCKSFWRAESALKACSMVN